MEDQHVSIEVINHVIELREIRELYHELLASVESKYENETRHETALRYIKSYESKCYEPQQEKQRREGK